MRWELPVNHKMSAEQAAEEGVVVGQPYTPPGRTAVFDVPSYDDIADLQQLFKRFANTTASYTESGGNVVAKTAGFTLKQADIGSVFLCNWDTAQKVTVDPGLTLTEGNKVTLIQLGIGVAQFESSVTPVKGVVTTPSQYQGIQAIYQGGTWWCVPFGASGGGQGGPVPVYNVSADTRLNVGYVGGIVAVSTAQNKDIKITIPNDDGTIRIGDVIVVSNVGPLQQPKIEVVGDDQVIIQDRGNDVVGRWRSVCLIKRLANTWLIVAGTGGGGSKSVPTPPRPVACVGGPGSVSLLWQPPLDDGGSPITSYVVEQSTDQVVWGTGAINQPDDLDSFFKDLVPGTRYYYRIKAANEYGFSDNSEVVSAVPSDDYNDAKGGTETTVERDGRLYKVHTFTGDNTLTVVKAPNPFRVLVVAAGGSGGHGNAYYSTGGVGGNGEAIANYIPLTVGSVPVVVGTTGEASTIASVTAEAGTNGGDAYNDGGQFKNGPDGKMHTRITSDITGVNVVYSGPNGATGAGGQPGDPGVVPGGGGGGGGGATNELAPAREGGVGAKGLVVVSYEIAPVTEKPIVSHTAVGEWTIDNYNPAYTYEVTATAGTATVSGNKVTGGSTSCIITIASSYGPGTTPSITKVERQPWFQVQTGTYRCCNAINPCPCGCCECVGSQTECYNCCGEVCNDCPTYGAGSRPGYQYGPGSNTFPYSGGEWFKVDV